MIDWSEIVPLVLVLFLLVLFRGLDASSRQELRELLAHVREAKEIMDELTAEAEEEEDEPQITTTHDLEPESSSK